MRIFSFLSVFALVFSLLPVRSVQATSVDWRPLASPSSVTLVGDLQNELGCAGDWDPSCLATRLTYDSEDQVWQGTFTVPAGNWQYKVATNGNWDNPYPPGFTNLSLNLSSSQAVKFYFSHQTPWLADNVTKTIAVVAGNFQSELGCSSGGVGGDWDPSCLRSWMQDPDGDGNYVFSTAAIPPGSYQFKVALNENWAVSYPASNVSFNVTNAGDLVTFSYNSSTYAVNVTVTPSGAGHDNNIWWSHLGHNSRDTLYRNPGGAVPTGTPVTLRLRAANGDLQQAKVRVWNDRTNTQTIYNMTKVAGNVSLPGDPGPYEFWEVTLPASSLPTVYWYRFIVQDGTATAYYEDDGAFTGGWGQVYSSSPDRSYQLTVYDPAFTTPAWVKSAVIYQVFPDRFRDGDASNNPVAGDFFYGAYDTIVRSNTTQWNTPVCDPRNRPGAVSGCLNKYSQNFYGGDLAGLISKLDYLQSLGVTAIYLNPIFESPSNHKYDTTNYGLIDDNFGTLADFQSLVAQANARGMKIILDGVFNHVSSDSPYMDRYGRYPELGACESPTSPYRSWFYFTDVAPGTGVCVSSTGIPNAATYDSWWGYDSLPKLNANHADVRRLIWNSATPGPNEGIAAYWINQGAYGWRLDVGGDVDPGTIHDPTNDYWEGFRNAVRSANANAYIVGEEWGNPTSWILGGEWDASMNYQFAAAILSFWRDTPYVDNDFNSGSSAGPLNPLTAEGVSERLRNLQERYPPQAFYAMMNLFDSHDTNRVLFLLDHNTYQNNTALYANPNYDWSDAIARLKGAVLMQMTLPGAPTIYYGDEIGLVGPVSHDGTQWQDDPYNRQPYPWLDESGTPFYAHLQNNIVRNTIFSHYQTLIAARHAHPALRTGSFDPLWEQSGSAVYAYGRKMADDSDAAVVVVNKGATPGNVTLQVGGYLPVGLTLTDVLSGASFTVAGDGSLAITNIPARGGYLLIPTTSFAGTRPAAPVISATAGSGQISLSWSAVSGATSYRIYRSRLSGGGYEQVGTTSGLSFNDTTVQTGLRYYYVVRAVAANGLVSEASNEVNAIPAYTINWANLQHPPSITAPRSLVTPTTHIYGRVYIAGVTDAPGPTSGLIAQVGYGNDGTLPTHASWKWFNATFNVQVGNNDEFMGQIIPDAPPGNYDYLYRYSTDGGNTWVYGAYNNIFYSNLSSYDPVNAGSLTITTPSDTTAPTAPTNLRIASASPSSIALAWDAHPNTDGDLYGFEIWRKNLTAGEPSFTRLTLLAGPALTAYTDNSVTSGHQYEYYITAVDNSANISGESNHVIQTAQTRMVAVTFRVTVPNPSPGTVYIAGNFPAPYPFWNPGGLALTETAPGTWEITLNLPEGFAVEYKYTRGNWDTVEKSATYDEISNRNVTILYGTSGTQLVTDTVATWRDPIVTSIIPANNATGVPANTTIKAFWNQPMPIPVNPSTCFSVSGPGGSVSGSISYVVLEMSYLFTPSSSLADGVYTVTINGCRDAQNDLQQVPFTSTFTVDTVHPTVLSITRNDPSPTNAAIVHFTVTFSEDVTGVDAADFSLFTSGVSGASVTGVTASSGSIYTVAVDTGSGSGTLRLDLNASGTGITDLNGNPMTSGYTGGETYIIDKTAPTLLSLTRQNPPTSPTNADVLVFRATFSEEVQNVHAGDFVVTGTTASLLNVVGVGSGPTYSVFDLTIAGGDLATLNGTVGVDLAVGQNILDLAGNSLPTVEPSVDQTYTVDNTAPQLLSFTRHNPAVSPTNADTLVFRVAFSEAVQNVDVTDFAVSGSTANVTLVTSVSASVYDVTVSGGDLATLNGFVGLNLVVSQNITDLAGNPLPSGEPPTDETYELDNQVTVLSILRQTPPTSPTNAVTVTFRVTFSEDVQNVDLGDFALTLGGTTTGALGSVTAQSASVYDVLVINVGGNGLLSLGFEATNDIADMHGNPLGATPSIGTIESYLIDHSGPTVLFGANTFPANGSLLNVGPTQIVIEYNKDVLADGSANAANHVNNYLLVEDGADDTFTSLSCAAPDLVGDTRITVNSVIYTNNGGLGPYLATLNINNGVPLPEGTYRLFVCGTTSVYDLLGNRLNNGADSILTFQVRAVGGAPSAPASLPETGFALGRITQLAPQPTEKTYAQTDLWLEIPKLGLKMKIVGVPLVNGEWDVSWLGKNAGWLEGSAFPSWAGNSVLTGHVWNADNTPGPFRSLHTLWWGDQIIVRVGNTEYIYEVRSVQQVKPWEVSRMMKHEERPWLTLVTCRGYDEKTGTYKYRILVRAVLVKVK